ncbi:glycosyltransferase family 2 protein [Pelagicoccus sp. SDUM812003]|uniref:glycosyltransferase family 2 protein n=1 Tax=Pelagicoccus sp. SDUM812003 TaxID=3041267 RepID=UPI00281057AE|nr:glycosyltransferase family 2 protein [Pelagicoccus sp. SDUM812003]MDQ8204991.1 glycosyltransferase family 2 protein [Pelagicoccus sp. SDUM812003]
MSIPNRAPQSACVIIASYNRPDLLKQTLESLESVSPVQNLDTSILIIENGTSAPTLNLDSDRIGPFKVQYLHTPIQGKSAALNLAVKETKADILAFTDDDVRFPRDWLFEITEPIISNEADVTVGGCRISEELNRKWMTRYHRPFLASTEYLDDTDPSEFAGVNYACHRRVFEKVPEFDTELGGGGLGNCEDSIFAKQLKQAGFRFASKTKNFVIHHPDSSRLKYQSWLKASAAKGKSEAYVLHHWEHRSIAFPLLKLAWLKTKLSTRSLLSSKQPRIEEGIKAWEMSYRVDIAIISHYLKIHKEPYKYDLLGLKKLTPNENNA